MRLLGPLPVRMRTFRILTAGIAVACLTLIGSGVYLATQWNKSTKVDEQDVLADFRQGASSVTDLVTTTVAPPAPAAAVSEAPAAAEPVGTPTTAPPDPAVTTPPSTAPAGPASFTRPAEGVYAYRATGGETLSIGGARHDYPSEVFAIVRHTPCGYRLEVPVLKEHVDVTEVCLDGTRLLLQSFTQQMTFFGQTDSGGWACAPPVVLVDRAAGVGAGHPADCTAAPLKATGRSTFVRTESTAIDGTTVEGVLVEWRWTASGDATGDGLARWAFDETGLPLRIQREHSTQSASVLGPATHAESATFVLESRSPRR